MGNEFTDGPVRGRFFEIRRDGKFRAVSEKSRRLEFTGNVNGAHGDDFYRMSIKDLLWLAIGRVGYDGIECDLFLGT